MSATRHSTIKCGFDLIVVLGSMGALEPLMTLVAGLPRGFAIPVLVQLHRPAGSDPDRLARLLQRRTPVFVRTARAGTGPVLPGITVIPGGRGAVLDGGLLVGFADGVRSDSGNALFRTAATVTAGRLVGVVLSGLMNDGAAGVRAIKRGGGRVLAQDPATARAPAMPANAIATGCVDFVLPPNRLAAAIVALTLAPGAADLFRVPTPHWARLDA